MMPSGHKAFVVNNTSDLDLLLMHNKTYAAEYVPPSGKATGNIEHISVAILKVALTFLFLFEGLPTQCRRGSEWLLCRGRSSWVSRLRMLRRGLLQSHEVLGLR